MSYRHWMAAILLASTTVTFAAELLPLPDAATPSAPVRPSLELLQFREELVRNTLSCDDLVTLRIRLLDRVKQEPANQNYFMNRVNVVNELLRTRSDCR